MNFFLMNGNDSLPKSGSVIFQVGFSSETCLVDRLAQEVELVFHSFPEEFSCVNLAEMKHSIMTRSFVLSPLALAAVKKDDALASTPQFFSIPELPEVAVVTIPVTKDKLLYLAMSRLLTKVLDSSNCFSSKSYGFRSDRNRAAFLSEVQKIDKVYFILNFDFKKTINLVSRTKLLTK